MNIQCKSHSSFHLALIPGSTQHLVACSMEKQGELGIFSHVSMM